MTSAEQMKYLKSIHNKTQFTVAGYIRQIQTALSLDNLPPLIMYLCLSYFYLGEYLEKAGDDLTISEDQMTVTKCKNSKSWENNAYGKLWIDSDVDQIAKWKLRIDEINKMAGACIFLAIVSRDDQPNMNCSDYLRIQDKPNFGIGNDAEICINDDNTKESGEEILFGKGDIITITINTVERNICYEMGDVRFWMKGIPRSENIKYKLAISLYTDLDSVSLLEFTDLNLQ